MSILNYDFINFELWNNHVAQIVNSPDAFGDVFIPRSINYQNHDYIITNINEKSFSFNHLIKSISFSDDSEVQVIGSFAFSNSSLERITIPPKVRIIGEKAFYCCLRLKSVEFKGNSKLESLEKCVFASSSLINIIIPSSVINIGEKAFDYCTNIKSLPIQQNSKLQSIDKSAFSGSSLEEFSIPSKVEILTEGWCKDANKLNIINVLSNDHFYYYDEKILLTKADKNSKIKDFLTFARRDLKSVIIPSNVKQIGSYSFSKCRQVKTVEFAKNSELFSIHSFAFFDSSINHILLPSNVNDIGESAFSLCNNLKFVEFEENSKLKLIDNSAFSGSSISHITIPPRLTKIEKFAFSQCFDLKSVEFLSDSLSIMELCFELSENLIIASFPNVKEIRISNFSFHSCSTNLALYIKSGVKVSSLLSCLN